MFWCNAVKQAGFLKEIEGTKADRNENNGYTSDMTLINCERK